MIAFLAVVRIHVHLEDFVRQGGRCVQSCDLPPDVARDFLCLIQGVVRAPCDSIQPHAESVALAQEFHDSIEHGLSSFLFGSVFAL